MFSFSRWQSRSATLLTLGTLAGAVAPLVTFAPASAQTSFSDVPSSYWARPFIQTLADEGVISGFPDGTFRPDAPVTRAQFAAIVRQAFNEDEARTIRSFSDVPANYWAAPAIREAYETGFMSGYPDGTFQPEQQIPKVQVLVSLASGLRLSPSGSASTALNAYSDASDIPSYATNGVTAATQRGIVVNYPNVRFLNPTETATRGDVAAYIYQALVSKGRLKPLPTNSAARQYIVAGTSGTGGTGTGQGTRYTVPQGTSIPVRYPGGSNVRIIVARGETLSNVGLEVASNVRNSKGNVLIPKGSRIVGELRPVSVGSQVGTQFYSKQITIRDQTYDVNATSGVVITGRATQPTAREGAGGTVASSTTRSVLGNILGSSGLGNILGVLTGQQPTTTPNDPNDFIYINPSTDLNLKIDSTLNVN
jgi:hypothetical protein